MSGAATEGIGGLKGHLADKVQMSTEKFKAPQKEISPQQQASNEVEEEGEVPESLAYFRNMDINRGVLI